jgi:hypothetical protein
MADLACAIAHGAEVISDFRLIGDQEELFGLVASVPTAWRTLDEIAGGGERALGKITAAVNAARRRTWTAAAVLPGIRVADAGFPDLTRPDRPRRESSRLALARFVPTGVCPA